MIPLILTALIVVDDQTVLRAAPEDGAPRSAVMWRGDWLELRGESQGYLSVYDHRRQRAGYVAKERVRAYPVDASSAARLLPVIEFLADSREDESLGIGLVALYLRVAPRERVDASLLEALGHFADRLAKRASAGGQGSGAASAAEHVDVARSYGIGLVTLELEGRGLVCYDGDAFLRVLELGATPEQEARAALALGDRRCEDPRMAARDRVALDTSQLARLSKIDPLRLAPRLANRVRVRRAWVASQVASASARSGDTAGAKIAFEAALESLTRVDRAELSAADKAEYEEAAVRVAAARWAAEDTGPKKSPVSIRDGAPGETCLNAGAFERCTYAKVWPASARVAPRGDQVAIAVEPVPGWLELWVLTKAGQDWRLDVLIPAAIDPSVGYVELAGWSPNGKSLLVAKEAKLATGVRREFQVLDAGTLELKKSARSEGSLSAFRRFSSPDWRRSTLALR